MNYQHFGITLEFRHNSLTKREDCRRLFYVNVGSFMLEMPVGRWRPLPDDSFPDEDTRRFFGG